jgi:glycosyltransferase involved in cell wall biosynthesis
MNTPFFSVITTTYNRATLLRQALLSLQRQTFGDFEAFIVDDASTDETPQVFDEFRTDSRFTFVTLAQNKGYPYAKNLMFERVRGKYVTFLDSDDLWLPERLARFHAHITERPGDGFIFSNGYIHQDGRIITKMFDEGRAVPSGRLPAYMAVSNYWLPYVTTNVAIRADAVRAVGKYREDMVSLGDTEYFARVIASYDVGVIAQPLSVYRIHPVSITRSWDQCMQESLATLELTNPPEDVRRMLTDFIYLSQASAMIKNGCTAAARRYLRQVQDRRAQALRLRMWSFTPGILLRFARLLFKQFRLARLRCFSPAEFRSAGRFMRELSL